MKKIILLSDVPSPTQGHSEWAVGHDYVINNVLKKAKRVDEKEIEKILYDYHDWHIDYKSSKLITKKITQAIESGEALK